MQKYWIIRFLAVLSGLQCLTNSAWAFKREIRVPLMGCRGHYAASGFARSVEVFSEANEKDRQEFVIQMRNVPLTPGTVLVVYVGDESVGNITLDAKQSGSIKITSDKHRHVPKLDWGTSVILTKIDGSIVSW